MLAERPADVPEHAECLSLFDHLKNERKPSRYIKGATALVPVFCCPMCKTRQELPFEAVQCGCGLMLRTGVSTLWVWPSRKLEVVK